MTYLDKIKTLSDEIKSLKNKNNSEIEFVLSTSNNKEKSMEEILLRYNRLIQDKLLQLFFNMFVMIKISNDKEELSKLYNIANDVNSTILSMAFYKKEKIMDIIEYEFTEACKRINDNKDLYADLDLQLIRLRYNIYK